MSADNSYTARLERLRNRTLAIFHSRNSTLRELGATPMDESTRQQRRLGQARLRIQPPEGPAYDIAPCCPATCETPVISNFSIGGFDYIDGNFIWPVTWTPISDTTVSFTVTPSTGCTTTFNSQSFTITGPGSASVYANINNNDCGDVTIVMTITSTCGTATISGPAGVCFLAGARVAMADGSEKLIEDVAIGDRVVGAFGEINTVLALHRPLLGANRMCRINGDHSSSNHHPHIGANKEFFSNDIAWLCANTYYRSHDVITEGGRTEKLMLHGVTSSRIQPMKLGASLKTLGGACTVDSLDVYDLPPETQLYNLVISGSHTYHVDGYAVTGWPREDDFDYDTWAPRI